MRLGMAGYGEAGQGKASRGGQLRPPGLILQLKKPILDNLLLGV